MHHIMFSMKWYILALSIATIKCACSSQFAVFPALSVKSKVVSNKLTAIPKRCSLLQSSSYKILIPRGGNDDIAATEAASEMAEAVQAATPTTGKTQNLDTAKTNVAILKVVGDAVISLKEYLKGSRMDTLLLLLITALNTPLCNFIGLSPILGFITQGIIFGPNGKNFIKDVHTTELLADLGVVLFLFEMGIHLNYDTLMSMRKDVFGLGLSQFAITSVAITFLSKLLFGLSTEASVIIGGALALSSSAFVLQLLKDKDQLSTKFGKSSFGVLLLQDLMVVPLLVIIPLLASGGGSIKSALTSTAVQATMALCTIAAIGRFVLNPLFSFVASVGRSQEAFVGVILSVVLGMSFLTEGLGLSNTLGAFLAGVLLADSKFKHEVEKEISPIRGILVGLFFFSVGFEIDLKFIKENLAVVASIVGGIVAIKTIIASLVCLMFGLDMGASQRVGLILSQGGEFAFVAFRTARAYGILDSDQTRLLLTCVSLTMATTPTLEGLGAKLAEKLDQKKIGREHATEVVSEKKKGKKGKSKTS